ncbi:M48 family metallopeptidase [soil metagenome]
MLKHTALVLAVALAATACATTTSPTGRTQSVGAVSQQQLNQMGAQAFAQMKAQKQQSNDSRQRGYVSCVVSAVVAQLPADERRMAWESAVFVDNSPNAFALPGGKVGVHTGIFAVARNQDQLAGVIAHEIGHVIARHHDERVTRQMQAQTGLGILGALVGNRVPAGTGQLAGMATQTLFLLPNNRQQETEADVVGQRLMAQAGFDPRGAVSLWENMIAAGGQRAPEFLSTHPDPRARIGELRQRAESLMPTYEQSRASGRRPNCG